MIVSLILLEAWQSHDIGRLALAISTAISFSVYIFINIELQRKKVKIFNFLEQLKQNFPTRSQLARRACLFSQKLSFALIVLWLLVTSIVWLVPLVSILLVGRNILFFPVPVFILHGFVYPISLFWSNLVSFLSVLQSLSLALVIVTLISLVCLEFDQLAHDIAALRHLDQAEVKELLPALIEKHIRAIDLTEKLNDLFSVIFLVRFVASIFAISIYFFAILSLTNLNDIGLGFSLIGTEVSQLFLICCVGQMLINTNDRIAAAVYNCGWVKWTNLNLKKSILMILRKSQEPATLTIWKFGSISLELFTSLANSMYEITSFMLAVYEN